VPYEGRLVGALLLALSASFVLTPLASRIATRLSLYDRPVGYKAHSVPTPYLGGLAVVAATMLAGIVLARDIGGFWPLAGCVVALWALGTLDDRVSIAPSGRVLVEAAAAAALWRFDLGWSLTDSAAANLALTVVWVVGVVNAFNLMDNMDGAACSVGAICASCAGLIAMVGPDPLLAVVALATAGGCLGFLPHNLIVGKPARIFLGDGGSIPLGFLVAVLLMVASSASGYGALSLLVAGLVVGLPILDTALVIVSRARRGVPVIRGGRDHLTHRLLKSLGSADRVVLALALTQAALGFGAVAAAEVGRSVLLAFAAVSIPLTTIAAVGLARRPLWKARQLVGSARRL
jgi:UDP-GlcNAc:undecaprenyl-phosphate GlcNAc-1-phosphate transferase